jgi:nicotinate-nucleotide adenylyltransferase
MSEQKEVIILGGTFNPPTVAHQEIARGCLNETGFDEVWMMPTGQRRDKDIDTDHDVRLAMLGHMKQEVFADTDRLVVSDFELNLPIPTETSRTVGALAIAYPNKRFWFVYGADSYHNMPTWKDGEELQRTLPMLLIGRPGYMLPPESDRVKHLALSLDEAIASVSSTEVRNRAHARKPIGTLVCSSVHDYIMTNGLYLPAALQP